MNYDADLPGHLEARIAGNRWYGKAFWLFGFAFWQLSRLGRLKGTVPIWGKWTYINARRRHRLTISRCSISSAGTRCSISSPRSGFPSALHPLGARWIQEHFTFDPQQETYDYYGPLNLVALNIGYHNEHHDFPGNPLAAAARIEAHGAGILRRSARRINRWTKLFFTFIFDPRYTLYSRVDRSILRRANEAAAQ